MTASVKSLTLLKSIDQETENLSLEPWREPDPLEDVPRETFPVEAFRGFGAMEAFARELAEFSQTPIDLPGSTMLGAISAAMSGKFDVEVSPGYIEPVCIYVLSLLQSGSRKSSVFRATNLPITAWERSKNTEERRNYAIWESKRNITEKKIKKLEEVAAKPPKDGPLFAEQEAELEIESLITQLIKDRAPRVTQIVADDITAERIASKLAEQEGSLAIMSPEGGFFGNIGGRYNDIPGLDTLLKGYSRDQIRVDRQNRKGENIPRPCITVCISAQPEIARELGKIPGFRNKGGAARFLVSMPHSNLGRRKVEVPPMDQDVIDAWHTLITNILEVPYAGYDEDDGYPVAHTLTLSPAARVAHLTFRREIEEELGERGLMSDMTDWASKMAGAAARIAAMLHVANDPRLRDIPIPEHTMQAAISIMDYFANHAFIFFDAMAGDDSSANSIARTILQELIDMGDGQPVKKRDLHQRLRGRSRFKDAKSLDEPLEMLQATGHVQVLSSPGTGRPSPIVYINPKVK